MNSRAKFLCCLLLVGLVEANTGPYGLWAERNDSFEPTTKAKVLWQDGTCRYHSPIHSVFVAERGGERVLVGETQGVKIVTPDLKPFTNYTITLKPGTPCPPDELSIEYYTGSGTPEPAETLLIQANNAILSVAVKMPRNREYLDNYSIEVASKKHNVTWDKRSIKLNVVNEWFNMTLPTSLMPNTHYEAKFQLIWLYKGHIFRSPPTKTEFNTPFCGLPKPENFTLTGDSKAVTLRWQVDESKLTEPLPDHISFGFFKVDLLCSDGSSLPNRPQKTEKTYTNLTPGTKCRVKVVPVYQVKSDRYRNFFNTEASYEFTVPVQSASSLTATLGDSADGFVDIKLSWKHSSCKGLYKVFKSVNGTEMHQAATTTSNSVTLKGNEFYSTYSITLQDGEPCPSTSQSVEVYTGAGKPHKVQDFRVEVRDNSVSFDILEASTMPRQPDVYVISFNILGKIILHNHTRDASKVTNGRYSFVLENSVQAENHYRVGVSPVISSGENLEGEPVFKEFDTTEW